MPVLTFARHALWVACGVWGAITLPSVILVFALAGRRRPAARPLLPLSDEEFEAAHRRLLRDARDGR